MPPDKMSVLYVATQVESRYGESISMKDITGCEVPAVKEHHHHKNGPIAGTNNIGGERAGDDPVDTLASGVRIEKAAAAVASVDPPAPPPSSSKRKAPTDSRNVPFEEWLRSRRSRDFLAEQVVADENLREAVTK